jgi:hypothetical protein
VPAAIANMPNNGRVAVKLDQLNHERGAAT